MSCTGDVDCAGWSPDRLDLLGRTLLEVGRELARRTPAPRGMPFFGLDHPAGEFSPFERLAAHGIFRKYESVLFCGAGLGGAARWCQAHFGCDVTGVDSVGARAAVAQALSQRAGMTKSTRFVAADAEALPFRPRSFTHVWAIETLPDVQADDPRVHQLFAAVRLGGLVSLLRSAAPRSWLEEAGVALRAAGFVEVETAAASRPPLRESSRRARERLLLALRESADARAAATAAALEHTYGKWPLEGGEVGMVFARRPS